MAIRMIISEKEEGSSAKIKRGSYCVKKQLCFRWAHYSEVERSVEGDAQTTLTLP